MTLISIFVRPLLLNATAGASFYLTFLGILTLPTVQDHATCLHRFTLTWFKDLNVPEHWGFLRNQVTPFQLKTADGETLHAWHLLPLESCRRNEKALRDESAGLCPNINSRMGFKLLKDDPMAQLVLCFHGAGATLGSGWRPQSYRALSANAQNVHVLAFDYGGFGSSTGWPSEEGLLTDALALVDFALRIAAVPPELTVVFAQSLGTAVGLSLAHHPALQSPSILSTGIVLVAPFAIAELLAQTYSIASVIPLPAPVARWPTALAWFQSFIRCKWPSKDKLVSLIRHVDHVERPTVATRPTPRRHRSASPLSLQGTAESRYRKTLQCRIDQVVYGERPWSISRVP